MSQKVCSFQGGYLLWCNNKYLSQAWVKLVNLDYQTLVYARLPISSRPYCITQVNTNGTVCLKISAVKDTVNIWHIHPFKTPNSNRGGECSVIDEHSQHEPSQCKKIIFKEGWRAAGWDWRKLLPTLSFKWQNSLPLLFQAPLCDQRKAYASGFWTHWLGHYQGHHNYRFVQPLDNKQVSGHCVVGKMMMHWKFLEESNCHSCYALVEDTCCWEKWHAQRTDIQRTSHVRDEKSVKRNKQVTSKREIRFSLTSIK